MEMDHKLKLYQQIKSDHVSGSMLMEELGIGESIDDFNNEVSRALSLFEKNGFENVTISFFERYEDCQCIILESKRPLSESDKESFEKNNKALKNTVGYQESYQTILDPPAADPQLSHSESTRPDWARAPVETAPTVAAGAATQQYVEDDQMFPWVGREEFVRNLIPHIVAAHPGQDFDYYRDAAILASRSRSLRALLSDERCVQFDSLPQNLRAACEFSEEQRLRPGLLRRRLTGLALRIDGSTYETTLVPNYTPVDLGIDFSSFLPFVIEAADALKHLQESASSELSAEQIGTKDNVIAFRNGIIIAA